MDVNEQEAIQLFQPAIVEKVALEQGAKSSEDMKSSFMIVYLLIFAIYLFVLVYGNMVAIEVAKEKTSRVMEICSANFFVLFQNTYHKTKTKVEY